jgi:phosphatidylserine decarboxylase
MVKDGFYFSAPLLLLGALLIFFNWIVPGLILVGLGCFVLFFFRDPNRPTPKDPGIIISPADGKVVSVVDHDKGKRISIFLSVFNVHVVRTPVSGEVTRSEYRKGKFLLAFDERASFENEQQIFTVKGEQEITFALIAGLIARRIIPWTNEGEQVKRGDRIALIRFGSRVDIFIPPDCKIEIKNGDRVRAGTSILARFKDVL